MNDIAISATDPTHALPTAEDVKLYRDRGYHITPEIIPHDILDRIDATVARYQAGQRDRLLRANARYSDWREGSDDIVRNNEFCSLQNNAVRDLVMQPLLGRIAARLAETSAVRLFDDQLIDKPTASDDAAATVVGWHTDGSYWSTCTSDRMLTAWIPLQDTHVENGTLCVVEGSHLWPESAHVRGFNDTDLQTLAERIGRSFPQELIKPIALKKGQASFHHMSALHGSMPNTSGAHRRAIAVHMQDHDNGYRAYHTPDGAPVTLPHDRLCRTDGEGRPDYRDPKIFPQIWPAEGRG